MCSLCLFMKYHLVETNYGVVSIRSTVCGRYVLSLHFIPSHLITSRSNFWRMCMFCCSLKVNVIPSVDTWKTVYRLPNMKLMFHENNVLWLYWKPLANCRIGWLRRNSPAPTLLLPKPGYFKITRSIPRLLVPSLLVSTGHHQPPCYWVCDVSKTLFWRWVIWTSCVILVLRYDTKLEHSSMPHKINPVR